MGHNTILKKQYLANGYCVRQVLRNNPIKEKEALASFWKGMEKYRLMPRSLAMGLSAHDAVASAERLVKFCVRWANLLMHVQSSSVRPVVPHLDNFKQFAADLGFPLLVTVELQPSNIGASIVNYTDLPENLQFRDLMDLGAGLSGILRTGGEAELSVKRIAKALDAGCLGSWYLKHLFAFEALDRRFCLGPAEAQPPMGYFNIHIDAQGELL